MAPGFLRGTFLILAAVGLFGMIPDAGSAVSAGSPPQSSASPASAPGARKTVWDGVYGQQQAVRGELAYREACSYCHGLDLAGSEVAGELAPELVGAFFLLRWDGPLTQLFAKIDDDMPKDAPGTVTSEATSDIIGYLLKANAARAGAADLPSDREQLREVVVTQKPR
jgi:hypothetical protein